MIHPTIEIVNFEIMEDARQPKTNRELMIMLGEQVKKLRETMERFSDKWEKFEEHQLVSIINRLEKLERRQSEWDGSWKFWIIIGGASAIVLGILNFLK